MKDIASNFLLYSKDNPTLALVYLLTIVTLLSLTALVILWHRYTAVHKELSKINHENIERITEAAKESHFVLKESITAQKDQTIALQLIQQLVDTVATTTLNSGGILTESRVLLKQIIDKLNNLPK